MPSVRDRKSRTVYNALGQSRRRRRVARNRSLVDAIERALPDIRACRVECPALLQGVGKNRTALPVIAFLQ